MPWLGVEAAAELGIPLERLVRVDPGAAGWADLVAAVLDGFEVVITRVPPRLDAGTLRRVQARVQAREAVLIAIGEPGRLARRPHDGGLDATVGGRRARVGPAARPASHRRGRRPAGAPPAAGRAVAARSRTARWSTRRGRRAVGRIRVLRPVG